MGSEQGVHTVIRYMIHIIYVYHTFIKLKSSLFRGNMLGERVAKARKNAKMSQRELAEKMGSRYDQTVISRVETGKSGLQRDGLSEVARILGVSVDYLLGMTEDPRPPDDIEQSSGLVVIDKAKFAEIPEVAAIVGSVKEVPQVAATVGSVMYEYDETEVGKVLVSWKWLEENGVDPEKCHLVRVGTDYMEPTLPKDSKILIDLSRTEFQSNGIYVMELRWKHRGKLQSALVARRVVWDEMSKDWSYLPDERGSPTGYPRSFEAPPRVIGKVMWKGNPF